MTLNFANISREQRNTPINFGQFQMDDDAFYEFCQINEHLKFERRPDGTIVAMPNSGGRSGHRTALIAAKLYLWTEENGGFGFDSSTAFRFKNGATRSPDAAWISDPRWNTLTEQQQEKFPPIAPDFVIELMSPTDALTSAKDKMLEYINNGVSLGWLINTKEQAVLIYRADGTISKHVDLTQPLNGENVLPGFSFDLRLLFQ
ncbi:Uma2 family endonuclease [Fibrella aquatilis]|uniref:Uma2 family endonuclease n=1 Tax=Fibrella aquatilis TaxID=2817059 RepID=A0A939G4M9_9BACT|nr:Uma2 family endonuclease [Fibrella aquatilis]MBO0930539.1 Uma2 family endonuclease [Fibrella aquatilis]